MVFKIRRSLLHFLLALGILVPATACSTGVPASLASPIASPTPDPCATENLEATVKPVNDRMREFDDYAALASNVVQSDLVKVVPPMQTIRRAAQDIIVPDCLEELKRLELAYMDTTLQTLLAFQNPNPNVDILAAGIQQARIIHDHYTIELARLLGATLTVPGTEPAP